MNNCNIRINFPIFLGFAFLISLGIFVAKGFAQNQMVKNGDTIEIHYTGKLENGSVFDKSEGREPLKFDVGTPGIIKGMNEGVLGMKVGESKTLTIPPEEAYGEWDQKRTFSVPLNKLPAGIKAGEKLHNPQGQAVVVKEVNGDSAILDGNHFLAGKTLVFDVKLVSIL